MGYELAGYTALIDEHAPAAGSRLLLVTDSSHGSGRLAWLQTEALLNHVLHLPNAAPVEYMEYLLNNSEVQVPSFNATAHKCEGVFESLNMITRLLLQKFINQSTAPQA